MKKEGREGDAKKVNVKGASVRPTDLIDAFIFSTILSLCANETPQLYTTNTCDLLGKEKVNLLQVHPVVSNFITKFLCLPEDEEYDHCAQHRRDDMDFHPMFMRATFTMRNRNNQ